MEPGLRRHVHHALDVFDTNRFLIVFCAEKTPDVMARGVAGGRKLENPRVRARVQRVDLLHLRRAGCDAVEFRSVTLEARVAVAVVSVQHAAAAAGNHRPVLGAAGEGARRDQQDCRERHHDGADGARIVAESSAAAIGAARATGRTDAAAAVSGGGALAARVPGGGVVLAAAVCARVAVAMLVRMTMGRMPTVMRGTGNRHFSPTRSVEIVTGAVMVLVVRSRRSAISGR